MYDQLFPGQDDGLIAMEEFEHAQRTRVQAADRTRSADGAPRVHPLSGLLVGGTCEAKIRAATWSNDYLYRRDDG